MQKHQAGDEKRGETYHDIDHIEQNAQHYWRTKYKRILGDC